MYKKCEEILNRLEQEGKIKRLYFHFPEKQELTLKFKDTLEDEVNAKYYLSDTQVNRNKSLRETLEQNNIEKDISYIDAYNRNIRKDDLSGTITTRVSDSNNTFIAIKNATKQGTVQKEMIPTLKTSPDIGCVTTDLRIRKLTPKECLKLMGFDDKDYEKIKSISISRSQIYKQAGNSIVVNVLEAIFKELFSEYILNLDKWSDLD